MKDLDIRTAIELGSPYPYTLVVTLSREQRPNVMGLSWWTFTSLRPPMVAIAVGHARYTHECIEANNEFVLCFPSEGQARAAWVCGKESGRHIDKLTEVGLTAVPSAVVKPPIIDGVTVAYECKVVGKMACSDHTLYNGEIVAIHGDPARAKHLFTVHYVKLISIDYGGNINLGVQYKQRAAKKAKTRKTGQRARIASD